MATAWETAKKRGCKYSFVDTFSFQAPEFYKKLGYTEVFALKEDPYTEQDTITQKNCNRKRNILKIRYSGIDSPLRG